MLREGARKSSGEAERCVCGAYDISQVDRLKSSGYDSLVPFFFFLGVD